MAQFPAKLLAVLPDLDDESACLVILNNISGLLPEEKAELRLMLQQKEEPLVSALVDFKAHQNSDKLIESLKEIIKAALMPAKIDDKELPLNMSTDLGTSTIKVLHENLLTYDTQLSISFNSQRPVEDPVDCIPERLVTENPTTEQRPLSRAPGINEERSRRLLLTEAKFRKLLNESKELLKDSKTPSDTKAKHTPEPICTSFIFNTFNGKSEQKFDKKPLPRSTLGPISNLVLNAPSTKPSTFGFTGGDFPQPLESPAFSGGGKLKTMNFSGVAEEDGEPQEDLVSTVQTEELFKKYISESRKEDTKKTANTIHELSYDTMLRYLEVNDLFDAIQCIAKGKGNELTKDEFSGIVDDLVVQAFGKPSDISKLNTIYEALNSENESSVTTDRLYGGLTIFCKGTCEDKMRAAFSHMVSTGCNDRNVNFSSLMLFMESVFKILIAFVPNAAKTAQIAVAELCEMTTKQCFEDNYLPFTGTIQIPEIVRWFSTHAISLAPSKKTALGEDSFECDNSIEYPYCPDVNWQKVPPYFPQMPFTPWGMPYMVPMPPQMYCYPPPQGYPYMMPNIPQTPYRPPKQKDVYYTRLNDSKSYSPQTNYSPQNTSWRDLIASSTCASSRHHSRKNSFQNPTMSIMTPCRKSGPMFFGTTTKRGANINFNKHFI